MSTYDLGDRVTLSTTLRDAAGEPTDATVTLTLWSPAGVVTTPAVTDPAGAGTYEVQLEPDEIGQWLYRWTATGLVEAVDGGSFRVRDDQAAALTEYCTVTDVRTQLGDATNTRNRLDEEQVRAAIVAASREIDDHCGRRFWLDREASSRVFAGGGPRILIDDVGSLDDLAVAISADGSSWGSDLAASAYEFLPRNAATSGQAAWAVWGVAEAQLGSTWAWAHRIRVTARWGWSAVPEAVRQACILRAVALYQRKDSPHGVAGFDNFGVVRLRQDPDVASLLQPFLRQVV